ncbi:PKD domain-containing protein [Flammeovirga sp. SubArs3]|uniref:PKD domain-containing protein n=1 Tax=Flammeovirga sp. SubArs3 TaxID=2995316 RepID=UPI00248B5094|nr:PKD domain-containing protein [Flammeovirga sp. SubArs3]
MKLRIYDILLLFLLTLFFVPDIYAQQLMVGNQNAGNPFPSDLGGCNNFNSKFYIDEQGNGSITNLRWDFGDGSPIIYGNTNPTKIFFNTSDNTIVYTITATFDQGGGEKVLTGDVTIFPAPEVEFEASVYQGCTGTQVAFTKTSSINVNGLQFLINGQTLTEGVYSNPLPANPGGYVAYLVGTTDNGCYINSEIHTKIVITDIVELQLSPEEVVSCLNTHTENFSVSAILSDGSNTPVTLPDDEYIWDFGDGSTATGQNVSHTFDIANGDNYTVTVSADNGGCPVSETIPVSIGVGTDMFSVTEPSSFCAFYPVTFTPTLPSNLDGDNITWDFGDGSSTQTTQLPNSVSHNFTNSTNANIQYTITSTLDNGCAYSEVITVPPMTLSGISITADQTEFCTDNNFTVNLGIDNLNNVTNFFWRLKGTNDQDEVNNTTPSYTFSSYGTYTIELVANDFGECVIDEIVITSTPIVVSIDGIIDDCEFHSLDLDYSLTQNGSPITDTSVSRTWTINGRNTGYNDNSSNTTFNLSNLAADEYDITIDLDFGNGCTSTVTEVLRVGEKINLAFSIEIDGNDGLIEPNVCNGTVVDFNNTTVSSIPDNDIQYFWDYNVADVNNPNWTPANNVGGDGQFTYDDLDDGEYIVGFWARQDGCETDPVFQKINVIIPRANFDLLITDVCDPNSITIQNLSSGASTGGEYVWDFEVNGRTEQIRTTDENHDIINDQLYKDLNVTYGETLNVTLTVYNTGSQPTIQPPTYCEDEFSSSVTVALKPDPLAITWGESSTNYNMPSDVCTSTPIYFNPGVSDAGTYEWTFTNTNTGSIVNITGRRPNYTFTEEGTWEFEVDVNYDNGCSDQLKSGTINVYEMTLSISDSENNICLGEPVTYSVDAGSVLNAPNITWEWWVDNRDGSTATMESSGSTNVIDDFTYTYTYVNNPQRRSKRVYLRVYSDACPLEVSENTRVTQPQLDFSDNVDDYINFVYKCDYIETYVDPKITDETVYNIQNGSTLWNITAPDGSTTTVTPDAQSSNIYQFNSFTEGQYTIELTITDQNGCSVTDEITFDVPELPIGEARFTPSELSLDCPSSITFTDLADNTDGNSITRTDADGNIVPITKWTWAIEKGGSTVFMLEETSGSISYFFEPGDYIIKLTTEDAEGCTFTADDFVLEVGGVSGSFYIYKKAGYAPLTTSMEAIPGYVSDDVISIEYIWDSDYGDGGDNQIQEFTYALNQDVIYTPKLIFQSQIQAPNGTISSCDYGAVSDEYISVFRIPEVVLGDIHLCTSAGDTTVEGYDKTFEVANVDIPGKFSYKGETKYQWFVDGNLIPEADGGMDSVVTFTYGNTGGYFEVDPDDEDGRDYTLKIWVDAEYVDYVNPSYNHTDTETASSERTFNVKYDPTLTPELEDITSICLYDSATFDASASGFTPFSRGTITNYTFEISDGSNIIETIAQEDSVLKYKFTTEGTYDITMTITSDNLCDEASITKQVVVEPIPTVDFSSTTVCLGEPTTFDNLSSFNGTLLSIDSTTIQEVRWYFDHLNAPTVVHSNTISPEYIFPTEGTYEVKLEVYTVFGCVEEIIKEVTINPLPSITPDEDTYICFGESITLSVIGGTTYEWSTSETTPSITVTPTADSTTYYVKAWNEFGCLTEDSVKIYMIPTFRESLTEFRACEGETIELDGSINEFEGTVENFDWSNGETTSSITVTETGDYTITNRVLRPDGQYCTLVKTFRAVFNELPQEFDRDTLVHCFNTGDITIQAPEQPGYTYLWDQGETTSSVTRSQIGVYSVTIIDTSDTTNCETYTSIEVIDPITDANFTATSVCIGFPTTLTADYINTDDITVEYAWNLSGFDTTTTTPILEYTFPTHGIQAVSLVVTPVGGCSSEEIINNVTVFELPEPSFSVEDICVFNEAEFINLSTLEGRSLRSGDFGIAKVEWDFNYDGASDNFTSEEFSPRNLYNEVGTFNVLLQITTTNGCIKRFERELNVHPEPTITITEDFYICEGETADLTAEGGVAYLWSNNQISGNISVQPTEDQTYSVMVTNEFGCVSYDSVTVFVIPKIETEQVVYEVCETEEVTLDANIGNYSGTTQGFVWTTGETSSTITVSEPGEYSVVNTVLHESGKECTFSQTFEVIHRPLPPEFAVTDTVICFETAIEIELQAPQDNGFLYYWEDTGETTSSVKRDEEGEYTVRIIDANYDTECETITSIQVTDICPPKMHTPTAMTPNQDGLNDEFLIRSKYALNIDLTIYNRWGEIIFNRRYADSDQARTEGQGWDAKWRGKLVPGSVYTVIIEYDSELDGSHHRESSHVTVIR